LGDDAIGWLQAGLGALFGFAGGLATPRLLQARLSFQHDESTIVKTQERVPDDVAIMFRGIPIKRLHQSTICVWNSGLSKIEGDEIVEPITIAVSDGDILNWDITSLTRPEIAPRIERHGKPTSGTITCSFRFLGPKDGFRLSVLHSGRGTPVVSGGTTKGDSRHIKDRKQIPSPRGKLWWVSPVFIVLSWGLVLSEVIAFLNGTSTALDLRNMILGVVPLMILGSFLVLESLRGAPNSIRMDTVMEVPKRQMEVNEFF
jgi:hypothetical protein